MYIKLNKGKCSGNIKIEILNIMFKKMCVDLNEIFKDGGRFYCFIM